MIESLIALAMPYLTDLILKNEEVQKFPIGFVSASVRWIKSWFLEDDPVTKTIVESDKPAAVKEAVLEAKLEDLLKNPQFEKELRAQLGTYQAHRSRITNVVDNAKIKSGGNVHIGTKGKGGNAHSYDEENVVKGGSEITTDKDFHLGNDYTSGDQ